MTTVKCICDHCGQIIEDNNRFCASYTGHNKADLCKVCYEEFINKFSNWLKNKSAEDSVIENYEKALHDYQQQIIELTERLDMVRTSRDWWVTQCQKYYKDCKILSEKLTNMLLHGVSLPKPLENEAQNGNK